MNVCLARRLYESADYLHDHLAVIHPAFIDECVRMGGPHSVVLGQYFLPPAELHNGKSLIRYIAIHFAKHRIKNKLIKKNVSED